jgi:hypothetical protein
MGWINSRTGRGVRLVLLTIALLALGATMAYAAIPDSNGVYTACRLNAIGTIRLIDHSLPATSLLSRCTARETEITWNAAGQPGPAGAAGAPGPAGPVGGTGPAGPAFTHPVEVFGPQVLIPVGETRDVTATCPPDTVAVAGGWIIGRESSVFNSYRYGEGWLVSVLNPSTAPFPEFARALVYCE